MGNRRTMVLEVNELPLRVLRAVAETGLAPTVSRLLDQARVFESEVREELPREPYPSQTWASQGMGVPWEEHGVWWYGDPKPQRYPFYWQAAAQAGRSVGLVGVLHSSPVAQQCQGPQFRFVVPDVFAPDPATIPARYESVQRLVLELTRRNSRTARLRVQAGDVALLRGLPRMGLRPSTLAALAGLAAGIAAGRVPAERLRTAQFWMAKDLFASLVARHDPDLSVLFTNHVAAAMHRYWYAMFPGDFDRVHYPPEWVERHRDDIAWAVRQLDAFLHRVVPWCERTGRTLVVTSSMGQGPSAVLDSARDHEAVIVDGRRFLAVLGIEGARIRGAMTPQLTMEFDDEAAAVAALDQLQRADLHFDVRELDRAGSVVTLSYVLAHGDGQLRLGDRPVPAGELGVDVRPVSDHSSGRHIRRGAVLVHNAADPSRLPSGDVVDYLDIAPMLLGLLGVEPLAHHRQGAGVR